MLEIGAGIVVMVFIVTLMSTTYTLRSTNEDLMRRVVGLENAMAAVEKSCTISSDSIANLDQIITPKLDSLEKKLASITKQSNLTTSQQTLLRRNLLEIRQSLAYTNARPQHRPNTTGSPLA